MTQQAVPFRSVPPHAAIELALREADRLRVRLHTELIGPPGSPTTVTRLSQHGNALATGSGKGPGDRGLAGAHFEALERYLMSASDNRRHAPGGTRLMPATTVAAQPELGADLVVQRWAAEFQNSLAACAPHHARTGTRPGVWYPVFLSDPRYFRHPLPGEDLETYRSVLRYSSSLGTAAGVTVAEAVLHGLCELVEHDGVSHALLRWFIAGDLTVNRVPPQDLPDGLRALHGQAQDTANAPVHLIDVTTELGIPVYLAVAQTPGGRSCTAGSGASPLAWHAAQRALDELLQTSALTQPQPAGDAAPQRLTAWPALRDCALLPVSHLLSGRVRNVALPDTPDIDTAPEPAVNQLAERLRRHNIEHFVCELAPPGSLVAVTTTIAPGLERFSLVRLGVPVLPTGRGWPTWAAALATRTRRTATDTSTSR